MRFVALLKSISNFKEVLYMISKNLFAFISCAAIFIFTFSASFAVAQIADEKKLALSDLFFPTGITGAWRLNAAESDDVLTKIGELL